MAPSPPSPAQYLSGASEAFRSLLQNQIQTKQLQQQSEQNKAENDARQAALDELTKYHQSQTAVEQAKLKAATALHNANATAIGHQLVQESIKSGAAVPGTETNRQYYDAQGQAVQPTQISPLLPGFQQATPDYTSTIQLPFGTLDEQGNQQPLSVQVPSAARAAAYQQTLQEPAVQAKIREVQAAKDADLQKALVQKQLDQERELMLEHAKTENASQIEQMKIDSATAQEKMRAASAERVAQIGAGSRTQAALINQGLAGTSPEQKEQKVNDYVQQAYQGRATYQELNTLLKKEPKAVQNDVYSTLTHMGGAILSDSQMKIINSVAPAISIIPKMHEWNDLWQNTPTAEMANPASLARQRLSSLQAQIDEGLTSATGVFAPGSRISEPRIQRMTNAYGMSKFKRGPIDELIMTNYENAINSTIKGQLQNLNQEQQNTILNRLYTREGTLPNGQKVYTNDKGQTFTDEHGNQVIIQ